MLFCPARLPAPPPGWGPQVTASAHLQVVEELLSGNPHIEKESARSIADGAMMEAASVCVGQMVSALGAQPRPSHQGPLSLGSADASLGVVRQEGLALNSSQAPPAFPDP